MMRRFFTSWKALVLAVVLIVIGGVVWQSNREPREPMFEGKKLSWWFTEGNRKLTREELRSLGPGAVEWLAYKAARSSTWDVDQPGSSAGWFHQIKWWLRLNWLSRPVSKFADIRIQAVDALGELGSDGVRGVPSILQAIRTGDEDTRLVAADALIRMGAVSWPALKEAIKSGDPTTRDLLIYKLDGRWIYEHMQSDPQEFAETVELLVELTLLSNESARKIVESQLRICREAWRAQPRLTEGVALVAASLANGTDGYRRGTARFLADFEEQAAVAVPALVALAETPDELTRVEVLGALALIDPNNARWPEKLRELATSPKKEVMEAAERALIHAGK